MKYQWKANTNKGTKGRLKCTSGFSGEWGFWFQMYDIFCSPMPKSIIRDSTANCNLKPPLYLIKETTRGLSRIFYKLKSVWMRLKSRKPAKPASTVPIENL